LAVLVLAIGSTLIHVGWTIGFWKFWLAVVAFTGGSCLAAFGTALFTRRPASLPAVLVVAGASVVTYALFQING
jgi:hypothetical protein